MLFFFAILKELGYEANLCPAEELGYEANLCPAVLTLHTDLDINIIHYTPAVHKVLMNIDHNRSPLIYVWYVCFQCCL